MKRKLLAPVVVVLLVVLLIAVVGVAANQDATAAPIVTVRIPANQTIEIDCLGDDLIFVTNETNDKAAITCRVWFDTED